MFWRGLGVNKNIAEALKWSKRAWETDEPLGYYNRGAYLNGWGLKFDAVESEFAYKKARLEMENKLNKNDPHYLLSLGFIVSWG